ncbi:hypothetical protein EZV73_09680 [Acidaminobacter sp. JC074]|uniref:hypothetical protein n=1 Tax=Acidaminobacter sp. JC074 TaxID=2530199 RepID=UPI001F101980|nr:hypothetical protein [Acidaminobacter sp. JC074]MCH4887843.1 hypothetical protein [Acidaminobacter sp. JC074]
MFDLIKKILIGLLVIVIATYIGMIVFFQSLHSPKSYHLEVLDDFLVDVEDRYRYVKDTSVKELDGELMIKVEYNGSDLEVDEAIYEDFRSFFMDEETQIAIIEKQPGRIKDRYFPIIIIEFVDITGMKTHYIQSPIRHEIYYVRENRDDVYHMWERKVEKRDM